MIKLLNSDTVTVLKGMFDTFVLNRKLPSL